MNVEVFGNPRCMVFAGRYPYVNENHLSRGERAYLSGSGKNGIIDIVRNIVASKKSFSIDSWLNAGYQIRCQGYGNKSGLIYDVVLPYDELRKKIRKYKSVSEEAQSFVYDMNLALKGDTVNADSGGLKCLELDEDAKCVIFKDKTIGLDSEHLSRDQRAYLIGKVRRDAKLLMDFFIQSAESPVKRLLNAGFSIKYQVYDENEVFVCDVVFQEEDLLKKQKSGVKEELAAYVHDMNSVLKVDEWKRDGDKLEYVKLDNDSACLVLGLNLSESDVADVRMEGSRLPKEMLKKQYVKELAERINDGAIILLKWCETDYPIKLLWLDKSGAVLYDDIVQFDDIDDPADDIGPVFSIVDLNASFPGGQEALADYLYKNLKYPEDAQDNGKQGRVLVQFIVNKDGSISDIKVPRSVYPSLDEEAVRVVKAMPKWISGKLKLRGKPVRVRFALPVTFRLS